MKLEVEWAGPKHPRQAKIHNVEIDSDEGEFEEKYVSFSGYFGNYGPDFFAAAPDLYEALEAALVVLENVEASGVGRLHVTDQARTALEKARGEK